jgi:hypothetical protein
MSKNMPHCSFKEILSHGLILTGDFRDKLSLQQAKKSDCRARKKVSNSR